MDTRSTHTLHTGRKIPVFGLGTWQLKNDTAGTVETALEMGYPMIDTSGDYGTQPGVGEGIKRSELPREEVYIVTKVEEDENSYEASRKNLKELQLDYADLMLIHRPPSSGAGEDLWVELIMAREEGLTKDIGVSNYSTQQIDQLIASTGEVPTVNQIEWSPFGYSNEMLDYARDKKMLIQAYSPLTRETRAHSAAIEEIALKYRKTPEQILIRWNLQKGTIPIPKANQKKHLEEDINVFDFELIEEDMRKLDRLNEHYSSLGSLPYV
jgi:diketogulonate reductase-like aldo/keto reductase